MSEDFKDSNKAGRKAEEKVVNAIRKVMKEVAAEKTEGIAYRVVHVEQYSDLDMEGIDAFVEVPLELRIPIKITIPFQVKNGDECVHQYAQRGIYVVGRVREKEPEMIEAQVKEFLSAQFDNILSLPQILKKIFKKALRHPPKRKRIKYIHLEPISVDVFGTEKLE